MKPKSTIKQAGYTIIEVVISIFIIGVVFVIFAAAANSVVLNRNAKHQELALRIATTKVEQLRNTAYDSLPSSGSFNDTLLSNLPSAGANLAVTDYNADTKQIVVTVSWSEPGNNTPHSVNLTTLVYKNGL